MVTILSARLVNSGGGGCVKGRKRSIFPSFFFIVACIVYYFSASFQELFPVFDHGWFANFSLVAIIQSFVSL